ncbi:MAG: SAM hydrolase/SAM-dependent halogenase family protein [Gammaproteobacteria bacterium]
MAFAPAGLITLTTDFGLADPFAGIVHGRILGRFPAARMIHLSHEMPRGRADLAGFWLARAWREFPPGTVHLAVVDPGVGTTRGVVLAQTDGHLLLAPDNGLLPEALRECPSARWLAMTPELPDRLGLGPLSRTFHGRDLFAPLAAMLASGALAPDDFGASTCPLDPTPIAAPLHDADGIAGQVVLADHFGNLFTNIHAQLVAACRQPSVEAAGRHWPLCATYGDVPPGAALALINAFGLLELAINGGNAARVAGLDEGASVRVHAGLHT